MKGKKLRLSLALGLLALVLIAGMVCGASAEGGVAFSKSFYFHGMYPYLQTYSNKFTFNFEYDATVTWSVTNQGAEKLNLVYLDVDGKSVSLVQRYQSDSQTFSLKKGSHTFEVFGFGGSSFSASLKAVYKPGIAVSIPLMAPGTTQKLKIANTKSAATDWASSAPAQATVDQKGNVKALKPGITLISCYVDGQKLTREIYIGFLRPNKIEMKAGETKELEVNPTMAGVAASQCTWSTSDKKVATVKNGVITAVGVGKATIQCKLPKKGGTITADVTVSPSLSATALTVLKGDQKTLKVAGVKKSDVTWKSSKPKVASVKNGVVTGLKKGTAVITCTVKGHKPIKCKVTVKAAPKLSKGKLAVNAGFEKQLTVKGAGDETVKWSSSNKKVATVTENGVIRGVAAGKAVIKCKIGKKITLKCTVTVKPALEKSEMEIAAGEKATVRVLGLKKNQKVKWSSKNEKIATVKDGVVTGVRCGTTGIVAEVNGTKLTCKVTVLPKMNKSAATVAAGLTEQLEIVGTDSPAVWRSSDPTIATVDENGLVTGVYMGQATITAEVGGKVCEAEITVQPRLDQTSVEVLYNHAFYLNLIGADASKAEWSSSDTSIASVYSGKVNPWKYGKATITCTVDEYTMTCDVSVRPFLRGAGSNEPVDYFRFSLYFDSIRCIYLQGGNGTVTYVIDDPAVAIIDPNTTPTNTSCWISMKGHGTTVFHAYLDDGTELTATIEVY